MAFDGIQKKDSKGVSSDPEAIGECFTFDEHLLTTRDSDFWRLMARLRKIGTFEFRQVDSVHRIGWLMANLQRHLVPSRVFVGSTNRLAGVFQR